MIFIELVKEWWPILAAMIAIIGIAFAVRNYIDSRVNSKLKDPQFLSKIAKLVSPSVIFNSNESILVDQGAAPFIKDISVEFHPDQNEIPKKIVVSLTQHFAYEPLLTPIQSEFVINPSRGKGNSWVFELEQFDNYRDKNDPYQFRLELVQ